MKSSRSALVALLMILFSTGCGKKQTSNNSQLIATLKSPAITSSMATEAEKLISKCMARQGFKYAPQKIMITGKAHEEPGIASPQFLRSHGYGISESITGEMPGVAVGPAILLGNAKDPNKDGLSRMSEDDRLAYYTALIGKKAAQSMASGGFAPMDSTEGCRTQSERAAFRGRQATQATIQAGLSDLQREIGNDAKVRAISLRWSSCMGENGYRYDSRFKVIDFLSEQAQKLMSGGQQPGVTPPGFAEFAKLEFQISAADAACSASDFSALRDIRQKYEDQFSKQYRTEIANLLGE
jgi:hypothetical protein